MSWVNTNISVVITPSDDRSGVKQWRYAISNDNGTTYGGWSSYILGATAKDILISSEGISKIKVEVTDNASNIATLTSGSYYIDKTAPTATSYDVVERADDTFTIDIVGVTDNGGSGVKSQAIKVWIDTPSGRKEKIYTPTTVDDKTSRVVVNRLDYGGYTKTYYYDLTLVDNVGNSRTYSSQTATMVQNNLTARRIDVYDPREKRYTTQTVKGLDYVLVLEVENNGERAITKNFDVEFKIDNVSLGTLSVSDGINKDQIKDYRMNFTASEVINLKGVNYYAKVDSTDKIYETSEADNISLSKSYPSDRSDEIPPDIPNEYEPETEKPIIEVPILNIDIDFEAYKIETYNSSGEIINELVVGDYIDIEYNIKNNSTFALKHLDISKKYFANHLYYDNKLIDTVTITDFNLSEIKKFKFNYLVPSLDEGVVEATKQLKLVVNTNKDIYESNEVNNIKLKNKKVIAIKLIDYQITSMVNPMTAYNYPILYTNFPVKSKAGYNVDFSIKAKGNPEEVYVKIKDSTGYDYGIYPMTLSEQNDSVTSTWTYTFYPKKETEKGVIIYTEVIARRSTSTYNFNEKTPFDGRTISINGSALEDIIIYRRY